MGKKTPSLGLTEQLLLLEEMKEGSAEPIPEVETAEEQAATEEFMRLVDKLARAVKKTSKRLERRDSTAGAELIMVLDPIQNIMVIPDWQERVQALAVRNYEPIAAFVRGDVALLPDVRSLAVRVYASFTDDEPEGWATVRPGELLGLAEDDEINDGSLEADYVQPLLDWLDMLSEHPSILQAEPAHLM